MDEEIINQEETPVENAPESDEQPTEAAPQTEDKEIPDAQPSTTEEGVDAGSVAPVQSRKNRIEQIAIVCHEANAAYCRTLGDDTQQPWELAEDWQKLSAMDGVIFRLKNPNSKPSDSHDNWRRDKLAAGWKYGAVKNPETKEHPCMVSYDQLPAEQRVKDALFIGIVDAMK